MSDTNKTECNPVYSKIKKLLALADNARNSSEAEATAAALKVQELLQQYGLDLAQVEAAVGEKADAPTAKRDKVFADRRAMYSWQRDLMKTLAEGNFCMWRLKTQRVEEYGKFYNSKRHMLVGRTLNIQSTIATYDYLTEALRRAAADAGFARVKREDAKDNTRFLDGAVSRLVQRLREQQEERRNASKKVEPGRGDGKSLVTLDTLYGTEEDANNDVLNGFPLGTTNRKRLEATARETARVAKEKELIASGVEATEAFYLSHGYEPGQAREAANSWNKGRGGRRGRGWSRGWTQDNGAHAEKVSSAAYKAGRVAGANIGLDPQVSAASRKVLK